MVAHQSCVFMGYTFFAGPQLQHTYEKAPDVDQPALTHEFAVCVVGHPSGAGHQAWSSSTDRSARSARLEHPPHRAELDRMISEAWDTCTSASNLCYSH